MNHKACLLFALAVTLLAACTAAPEIQGSYDPAALKFDGEQAFAIEKDFVARFPNRASGYANNRLAAGWIEERLTAAGWNCAIDEWEITNYSQPVALNNVVCKLPGADSREILVIAHLDQAMTTIEGADNDAAGIAILLHLGEIFAREGGLPYSLAFVATDAEEYGMIGSRRYVTTHPDPNRIIAGFSLDNVGRSYYDGVKIEQIGQYRGFGALWLALAAKEAARHAGAWEVYTPSLVDQITGQMAPISMMDQGPLVAAGIPALGMAGREPPETAAEHFRLWHSPDDTLAVQSAAVVGEIGRVAEALLRQLLSMKGFPQEKGPYLYLPASRQVLRGWPLSLIFAAFVALFFAGSLLTARRPLAEKPGQWRTALPHFLGLWLPLIAYLLLLYLFVEAGWLLKFDQYPATSKDPYLTHPNWLIFGLSLAGLAVLLYLGRLAVRRLAGSMPQPQPGAIKSLALLVIGLAATYILVFNPFSLLFIVPLLFWFLITGRKGAGRLLDILFFLLGGLMLYALIYMFGFQVLHYNLGFLWMLLNMIATGTFSFLTMAVIAAMLASGLAMIVAPPKT